MLFAPGLAAAQPKPPSSDTLLMLRITALALTAMIFATGVARADLWINLKDMTATFQDGDRCTFERYNHREAVYSCRGAGRIEVTDWERTTRKSCLVRWWGTSGGHWHYEIQRNAISCKGYWQNSNTLDITYH